MPLPLIMPIYWLSRPNGKLCGENNQLLFVWKNHFGCVELEVWDTKRNLASQQSEYGFDEAGFEEAHQWVEDAHAMPEPPVKYQLKACN